MEPRARNTRGMRLRAYAAAAAYCCRSRYAVIITRQTYTDCLPTTTKTAKNTCVQFYNHHQRVCEIASDWINAMLNTLLMKVSTPRHNVRFCSGAAASR